MLNKLFAICVVFLSLTMPIMAIRFTSVAAPVAHAQQVIDPCNDPNIAPSADCPPPTLQSIEFVVVRVIYFMWGITGVVFMLFLVRIGWMYYLSNAEQERISEARRMAVRWGIGLVLIFVSRPIVATVMNELVADNDSCFENLRDPGFTFFFEEACTSGDANQGGGGGGNDNGGNNGGQANPPTPVVTPPSDVRACSSVSIENTNCSSSFTTWDQTCESRCEDNLPVPCIDSTVGELYRATCNCGGGSATCTAIEVFET